MKDAIDSSLQSKYRETVNAVFGVDNKKKGYFISPSEDFVADIGTALLLKDSSVLLTGPPGVGKGTILKLLAYHLTGDPKSLAVVNCTEETRAEDFIYQVVIRYLGKHGLPEERPLTTQTLSEMPPSITELDFEPKPRPLLTCTFGFVNEVNRLNSRARNALLSILAERSIVAHGKELRRPTGIILMDMNPHVSGPLEWAFIDRVRANIHVPALLELGDQLKYLRSKYGGGKHVEDLVALAMAEPAPMNLDELRRVWEDVDKVEMGDEQFSSIVLFTNVFSSCKFDLSTKWLSYELPCEKCEFKENCVTRQLEHPVFTRSLDHIVKTLKAQAYFMGRDHVELKEDMLSALRRVMLHRLDVKPEYASRYVDAQAWYDSEVEQRILTLQESWKQAKVSYDEIARALKSGREADATKLFNTFRKRVRDVVSLRIVEMLEPSIEAATETGFKKAYAKCLAYEKAGYSRSALKEFEAIGEELPPKFADELSKVCDKLLARLQGIVEVKYASYKDFVVALAKVDASASDMAKTPSSWGSQRYTLSDGSNIEVRAERDRYIIKYDAETSAVADAIREFSIESE